MDECMAGKKVLSLYRRFKSLHLPFSTPRWAMGVFRKIFRIPALTMFNLWKQCALSHAIASWRIGHAHAQDTLKTFQQPAAALEARLG